MMAAVSCLFVLVSLAMSGLPAEAFSDGSTSPLVLVINIPDPEVDRTDGVAFLSVEGWDTIGDTGGPMLPERTFLIPLGPHRAVFSEAYPAGGWTVMSVGAISRGSTVSNGVVTVANDAATPSMAALTGTFRTEGGNFISIRVAPFTYEDGAVVYPSEVRVELEMEGPIPAAPVVVPGGSQDAQWMGSSSSPIWEGPVATPSDAAAAPSYYNQAPPTEMVIITTSTYNSTMGDLAAWKTRKGIFTRVVEVGWITGKYTGADTPEKVRKYITDLYQKESLKWVVLAGDHDTVPSRMAYVPDGYDDSGSDGTTVPADSYYSDLTGTGATPYDWDGDNDGNYGEYSVDGIDLAPEVYVGRLSASSTTQMANLVKNIIDYERSPPSGGWTNRSVVAGAYSNYKSSSTSNDTTDEADLKEAIRKDFMNSGKYNVYTLYEKAGIWPSQQASNASLTNANMVSAINPGAFMVNMAGHGSSTGIYRRVWNADTNGNKLCDSGETYDTAYYSTSASQTNGGKRPLFYNDACNNGEFDRTTSLTEDILADVGIGAVGSARVSWYEVHWSKGTNGGYYNQGHDYRFWQQFFNGGNHQPGRSLALSKPDYISDVGSYMDLYAWKNLMQYNLMGDPEVPIWTQAPRSLTVTYASPLPTPGEVSITVKDASGTAVPGARVCLKNGTVFFAVSTTDSSGVAKVTLPALTMDMDLTVTKNDHKAWTRSVPVGLDKVPPTITSVGFAGSSTTGDPFQVTAAASDPGGISMACVHHAYSAAQPSTFSNTSMTYSSGTYSHIGVHPSGSTLPFWYRVGFWDGRGNANITAWTSVPISDDDRPVFGQDSTQVEAHTGDQLIFGVDVADNIAVTSVHVNYTEPLGASHNLTMSGSGTFTIAADLPTDQVGTLRYAFIARDMAGNVEQTVVATRVIEDDDAPSMVSDLTSGPPTTGDPFTLELSAADNIALTSVRAEYTIGDGPLQNRSMALSDGNYSVTFMVPSDETGNLTYRFMMKDGSGNVGWTGEVTLEVLDDDLPGHFDERTGSVPTTGDPMVFAFDVLDNVRIGSAWVEYSIMGYNGTMQAIWGEGHGQFEATLEVPLSAVGNLSYRLAAQDTSGNVNYSEWREVAVMDDDLPTVLNDTSPDNATTGEGIVLSFVLEDNIGIGKAWVVWSLEEEEYYLDLQGPFGERSGVFTGMLIVPDIVGTLVYKVIVEDPSLNHLITDTSAVPVLDNDKPVLFEAVFGDITTGDPFTVEAILRDNIAVVSATLEARIGDMVLSGDLYRIGTNWTGEIEVPSNASGAMYYRIMAEDRSGNVMEGPWTAGNITDDDDPAILSSGGMGALILTTGETFHVTVEATDNIGVTSVVLDLSYVTGTVRVPGSGNGTSFQLEFLVPDLNDSAVVALLTVCDLGGNQVNRSFDLALRDNDPPEIEFIGLPSTVMQSAGCTFRLSSKDNVGVRHVTVSASHGIDVVVLPEVDGDYAFTPSSPGEYMIRATGVDDAGNSVTVNVTVNVDDDVAPEAAIDGISEPGMGDSITLTAGGGTEAGATYTWEITSPSGKVTTLSGRTVQYTPGEAGEYSVELTVTDATGNEETDTMTFSVPDGDGGNWWIIFAGIAAVLLVLAVLIIAFLLVRRRRSSQSADEWE